MPRLPGWGPVRDPPLAPCPALSTSLGVPTNPTPSNRPRAALVTGASRGIGAAIARRLAADGFAVAINYRQSAPAAEALVAEITRAGGRAIALQADVRVPAEAAALVRTAAERLGGLDALVNNAGGGAYGTLADVTPAQIDELISLNVTSALLVTQAAARLLTSPGGRIVNIGTIAALRPPPGRIVYAAAKAALHSVTRSLALELGPRGITVNAVAPGLVDTDRAHTPENRALAEQTLPRTPLGRIGTPDDVAGCVAWLVSADAAWVTGEVVGVSGGLGF